MRRLLLSMLVIAMSACVDKPKPKPPGRPLELTGYLVDGTGIDVSTLRGKPYVIDLWRVT